MITVPRRHHYDEQTTTHVDVNYRRVVLRRRMHHQTTKKTKCSDFQRGQCIEDAVQVYYRWLQYHRRLLHALIRNDLYYDHVTQIMYSPTD